MTSRNYFATLNKPVAQSSKERLAEFFEAKQLAKKRGKNFLELVAL
jgi:hypothetical protein